MRVRLPYVAALALLLAAGPAPAQQPARLPADTGARTDAPLTPADSARRAPTPHPAENPCLDATYVQLRRIPIERMNDTERRAFDELDRACVEARVDEAQRRMRSVSIGRPDYANEVVPWIVGVAMFCTAVIMFAQAAH